MTFNVSDFKGQVRNWLRPNHFEVELTLPAFLGDGTRKGRLLRLRTEEVSIPGSQFAAVDNHKPYGNGLIISIPHTKLTQDVQCTHNIDGDGDVLQLFYDWTNNIVNMDGTDNSFSASYYDEYIGQMVVKVYDVRGQLAKRYRMFDVYPVNVDVLNLSWAAASEVSKINVSYRVKNHIVD